VFIFSGRTVKIIDEPGNSAMFFCHALPDRFLRDPEVPEQLDLLPHATRRPDMTGRAGHWVPKIRFLAMGIALVCTTTDTNAITLAQAAALPIGTQVTIDQALVINSTRMTVAGIDLIQLRDDTRAVTFFAGGDGLPLDDFLAGIYSGDVISFTATTLNYNGLFELTTPLSPASVVSAPTINTNLDPIPVSTQDFNDLSPTAEDLESRYVELQNIELFFGGPNYSSGFSPTPGPSVAGEQFQRHTTYIARDTNGNESIIWARSQASVDSLNAHFGSIPAGPFNLPGIFLHAFDPDAPLPGITGVNYILNPVFVTLPGDLNADGFVGIADLNITLINWNQAVPAGSWTQGDTSGDGFVGIEDLNLVLANWNAGSPPALESLASVPEPGTFAVGLCVIGPLLIKPKRPAC
jgi:hypothetical protein